jgi:hypothetical protein
MLGCGCIMPGCGCIINKGGRIIIICGMSICPGGRLARLRSRGIVE